MKISSSRSVSLRLLTVALVLFMVLVVLLVGCERIGDTEQCEAEAAAEAAASLAKLEAARAAFYAAIESGDRQGHFAMFAEDGMMLPDGYGLIRGREALEPVVTGGEGYVFRLKDVETVDWDVSGDIAYFVNQYFYTWHEEGAEPEWHRTKNVHVWKRQADGEWRLHADIWNRSGE